jgi:excisionase family DNA binding protein
MAMESATSRKLIQRTNDLLDDGAAAEFLNISAGTLSVWRSTGRYALPFVKIGRNVRYRLSDLEAWIEQRTRSNGATA